MQRKIVGFDQDEEGHWRAWLECGHGQHMRHDPPWMVREWVTTEVGRMGWVGRLVECKKCDDEAQGETVAGRVDSLPPGA